VDKIIVNSLEFKKDIKKKFSINSVCIYNPLNKDEIILKSKKLSNKIYKNKNSLKIINIGRLVDQKNQIIILEAIKSLVKNNKINIELILVGDGNLKKYYENYIFSNKLSKIVKIMKFNKNPYNLLAQSDLFILSSKFEGLPNVLLEAATLGKFIISSNCPTGPKEILLNGKGGLLYNTDDSNDLKNKILFFIKNRSKSRKMLLHTKKKLIRFSYKKNLNKYLEVIKELIK
jgi:glycosyltransferase involved in cell wall biosynthesis